jgi:hypothetical protein
MAVNGNRRSEAAMFYRPLVHIAVAVAAVGIAAAACSSAPSVEDYCGKLKARADACPRTALGAPVPLADGGSVAPTAPAFDQVACETIHRCFVAALDTSVIESYLECASSTDCSVSTSKCDVRAFSTGPNGTEADRCAKKFAECETTNEGTFGADVCATIKALNGDTLSNLMPCIDKPCGEVASCLEAATSALGADCESD